MSEQTVHGMKLTKDLIVQMFLKHARESKDQFMFWTTLLFDACGKKQDGIDEKALKTVVIEFSHDNSNFQMEDTDLVKVAITKDPVEYIDELYSEGYHIAYAYPMEKRYTFVLKFYREKS